MLVRGRIKFSKISRNTFKRSPWTKKQILRTVFYVQYRYFVLIILIVIFYVPLTFTFLSVNSLKVVRKQTMYPTYVRYIMYIDYLSSDKYWYIMYTSRFQMIINVTLNIEYMYVILVVMRYLNTDLKILLLFINY